MAARPTSPAALPSPGDPRALYVLDVSGYVFRAYHALPPLSSSRGEPTHAVRGVTAMLRKLVAERRPAHLAVAMDSKEPSFRKGRHAAYKANRPEPPADLSQQIERVREVVEAYRLATFHVPGMEADDLIATVVRRAREAGYRVVIVSADKDLLQLVCDDVVMYDTMRGRVFGPAETREKLGVWPEQVRDYLALTGDASDNVPGVPSVGPKTAAALLDRFGTLDQLYAHLDDVERPALREKLRAHRDDAELSRELVTLRDDVPLDLDVEALSVGPPDRARLAALFRELEFLQMLAELEEAAPTAESSGPRATPADPGEHVAAAPELVWDMATLLALVERARAAGSLGLFVAVNGQDPLRGAPVGVGLAGAFGQAYVPVGHRYLGAPAQLPWDEVRAALGPVLGSDRVEKHCASAKDDAVALGGGGRALCGVRFDALLASYLLDPERRQHDIVESARERLGRELRSFDAVTEKQRGSQRELESLEPERVAGYATERAAAAVALAEPMRGALEADGLLALYDDVELPLARVLAAMELRGVRLDVGRLEAMGKDLERALKDLERRSVTLAGREFNLNAPRQLETILFDELHLPVIKKTKTARSTDHEVLEELASAHDLPATILEHRALAKLQSTYVQALPRQVDPRTGRVHTRFNQAVAATGRLSSSEPNLQNIPIRTELGRSIRRAFVPEPGWLLCSADYSQVELRVLAHLSRDPELTEAFVSGEDVHLRTARAIFEVPSEQVTREMRGRAKTVNYAVIYGQTEFALAKSLKIERREAARYIDAFFDQYAGVRRFMDETVERARAEGGVRTILGRTRRLRDLESKNRTLRQAAERVARNSPIQGSAADIMKVAMVALHGELERHGLAARMVLTVHDELVLEAPPEERERVERLVRAKMEHAVKLEVPLVVDLGWGEDWGSAH